MPVTINEPLMSMTIQVVQEKDGECIYRSRHFEFASPIKLGVTAMKEVCRAFESTHELVSKLPWGVVPWPEEGKFFRAQLYQTRESYMATGAQAWSAGTYSIKDKVFRIPFASVGLAPQGYLSGSIVNDTITHEATHQMMHEYLRFVPVWFAEGTAEYTSNLPYNSGKYNVAAALEGFKRMRRTSGLAKRLGASGRIVIIPKWVGVEELWGYTTSITQRKVITDLAFVPPTPQPKRKGDDGGIVVKASLPTITLPLTPDYIEKMASRYFSAHALVFYFMHFDGDGKALRIKRYFDAIHEERKKWPAFWDEVAAYDAAVARFKVDWELFKLNPGVVDLGEGKIRYPANLKPPVAPAIPRPPEGVDPNKVCVKHLNILLGGRSLADLDRDVRAAFAKAGSPL